MAELLKVAQLAHEHGVAEVQVGGGGVEAGFDAQGAAGFAAVFKALAEVADADDFGGAFLEQIHLFVYRQERTDQAAIAEYKEVPMSYSTYYGKRLPAATLTFMMQFWRLRSAHQSRGRPLIDMLS